MSKEGEFSALTLEYSSFGLNEVSNENSSYTLKSTNFHRTMSKSSSRFSTTTTTFDGSSVIIAIAEGRGLARGEIGITSVDLMSPLVVLSQFSDSQTYAKLLTKINALNPTEIIMPNTTCESSTANRLFNLISENFPDIMITHVQRKYFNDSKGLDYIKQLCIVDYSKCIIELTSKYYCLSSCAALLKYIEFMKNIVFAPHSIPVIFQGAEKTVIIDPTTSKYLELIRNARDPKSKYSLYGTLNYTKTRSGARILRANILQPPYDFETIQCRLETVEELIQNEDLFYGLKSLLAQFLDVEHLLSLCVQLNKFENVKESENKILNTLYLKHTLELIKPFCELLEKFNSKLIKAYSNALKDDRFENIKKEIDKIIQEDVRYQKGVLNIRLQKCFAIKRDVNGLLDITRRTFAETIDDINDYITNTAQSKQIPIRLAFNTTKGYHMLLNTKGQSHNIDKFPEFIKISRTKNCVTFTTKTLEDLNDRINELEQNIYSMSNSILNELFQNIRKYFGCLYKLIESISILDMLQSFSHAAMINDYIRPEYGDTLAIKSSVHPILQKLSKESPITNNIYASKETSFILITGANMSGKSTYLRQIAMLQIMSQIGSFLPASYASIRLITQIFTRIGTDDNIEFNSSSFEQEMIEMNYILNNFTNDSLILIDELCRSTSKDEGLGISMAICEHLIKSNSFIFFATHLNELSCLDAMYSKVVNYHLVSEITRIDDQTKLVHKYLLKKGVCELENYGLRLAEITCLPKDFIEDAKALVKELDKDLTNTFTVTKQDLKRRCLFKLYNHLLQCANNCTFDNENLGKYLIDLKTCFEDEYNQLMS